MSLARFLSHENEAIRELVRRAIRYRARLDSGEITDAEYQTLCRQLVDLRSLEDAAGTAERRLEFQQVAQALRAFLGMVL